MNEAALPAEDDTHRFRRAAPFCCRVGEGPGGERFSGGRENFSFRCLPRQARPFIMREKKQRFFGKYFRGGMIMKVIRFGLAAAGLAALVLGAAGCGGDTAKSASSPAPASSAHRTLRVAGTATYAPFYFKDEAGNIVGFDADITKAVAKEIGADVTYTSIPFNELVPAIEANKADIAVSAIDMTRDRADRVNFSNMYYSKESAVILASKDNETIHDPADLAGKTVAVEKGTVYEQTARDYGAEVKAYDYHDATFRAVENKEADALITDMPAAYYYMKHGGEEKLKPAGILAGAGGFVMLLNKKDVQLQSDINQALAKLMSNGEYDKIYDKWFADVNFDSKK